MTAALALATLPAAAPGAAAEDAPAPLDRLRDIAPWIARCWHPPHEDDEITLRLSFSHDGALIGPPRITFLRSRQGPEGDAALANSMLAALRACTPLRLTPAFADAIAGRVFAIRFVGPRHPAVTHAL
jgi:hypothetical protein